MLKKTPGFVSNIRFEDIRLTGMAGKYLVQLAGADATHAVKTVDFKNVVVLDQPLTNQSKNIQISENVEAVTFETGGQ
jgi:hypothetical protein